MTLVIWNDLEERKEREREAESVKIENERPEQWNVWTTLPNLSLE